MLAFYASHRDLIIALGLPLYVAAWALVMQALSVLAAKVPGITGQILATVFHKLALAPAPRTVAELEKDLAG